MRPPILFLTVAFGVGLWAGLDPFVFPGRALPGGALWVVALPVLALAAWLARRAPLGAAVGIMGVAGKVLGTAGGRGGGGTWAGGGGRGERGGGRKGATRPPGEPAPPSGGGAGGGGGGGGGGGPG